MRFEDKIRCLALLFDLSVTSWIRSRAHNSNLGGVSDSRHLLGLAVDIVLDDNRETADFRIHAVSLGLQVIHEPDHLHVQEPRE